MAQTSPMSAFNSISNWDVYVTASQMKESRKEPIEPFIDPSFVHLDITVSACLFSDDPWNDEFLEIFSMVGSHTLVSSTIDSPTECREEIRNILSDMGVPQEFRECTWGHRYLDSEEEVYGMSEVEDVDGLVESICWFLYKVKTQIHNKDFTFLPINLEIMKRVVVPDDEFEACCSCYERMLDDFKKREAETNSSPRTEEAETNSSRRTEEAETNSSPRTQDEFVLEFLKHGEN